MKAILSTRLLRWKYQKISLLFWLLFPLLCTLLLMPLINKVTDDTKVPIGLVVEEESILVSELVDEIEENDWLAVQQLNEREALNLLEKHELDSVFVIRKGYEENIYKSRRNRLIKGYTSDLSFAYTPVSELVISHVQRHAGRVKAVLEIQKLYQAHDTVMPKSLDELVAESKEIEAEQQLLETSIVYYGQDDHERDHISIIQPWLIWAYLSLLATFLLFDWIIKERTAEARSRFSFMAISFKRYLVQNLLVYTVLLFIFDLMAWMIFGGNQRSGLFLLSLLTFRAMLNLSIFLLALKVRKPYHFYIVGFTVTIISALVTVIGFMQTAGKAYEWLHPLQAFLNGSYVNIWTIMSMILFIMWTIRKEDAYVKS